MKTTNLLLIITALILTNCSNNEQPTVHTSDIGQPATTEWVDTPITECNPYSFESDIVTATEYFTNMDRYLWVNSWGILDNNTTVFGYCGE